MPGAHPHIRSRVQQHRQWPAGLPLFFGLYPIGDQEAGRWCAWCRVKPQLGSRRHATAMSLNAASLVDLKAELARKQEQFRREKLNPEQRDIRLQVGPGVDREREREFEGERETAEAPHAFLPIPFPRRKRSSGRRDGSGRTRACMPATSATFSRYRGRQRTGRPCFSPFLSPSLSLSLSLSLSASSSPPLSRPPRTAGCSAILAPFYSTALSLAMAASARSEPDTPHNVGLLLTPVSLRQEAESTKSLERAEVALKAKAALYERMR